MLFSLVLRFLVLFVLVVRPLLKTAKTLKCAGTTSAGHVLVLCPGTSTWCCDDYASDHSCDPADDVVMPLLSA